MPEVDNVLLDEAVMHHIALRGLDDVLPLPYVIGHMVTPHAQRDGFLREPEEGQRPIHRVALDGREHQNEGCQVAGG